MSALNPEIIKDTKILISLYQKNIRFKTAFDRIVANNINATYHGRPVKLYVEVLKNVTSKYKQEYSEIRKIAHDTEGRVGELFNKVNPNTDFRLLDQAYEAALKGKNTTTFEKEEIDEINDIEGDSKNNNKEKRKSYERREERIKIQEQEPGKNPENKKSYNPASQEERDRLKVALLPKEEVPKNVLISPTGQALTKPFATPEKPSMETLVGSGGKPIRNIYPESSEPQISVPEIPEMPVEIQQESEGQPSLGQPSLPSIPNIPRPSRIQNIFRGGANAGKAVATGASRAIGKMGIGTAVKAGVGAAAKLGAKALLGAATGGVGLVIMLATSFGGNFKDLIKWIVIVLFAAIAVFFLFSKGIKMNSLLPPYDVPTMDSVNGDITSCKFYRANEPASYKSSLLLSYISEASNLTGIPPAVLAAFIRVESPASVGKNDDQIRNYAASCVANEPGYISPTGALGIMQIQPPGTKSLKGDAASCDTCIDAGAKLLGKTVQTMTTADYCDPRTNIIVGSGFILKKMEYLGYKNSGKWDPAWTNDRGAINALVNTYYGDLKYNDVNGNEQDYGVDVWTSIQNCKLTGSTSIVSCPLNGNKVISCGSYMSDPKFNIGVCRNPNLSKEVPSDRGHCGNFYPVCTTDRKKHSIDINAQAGEEVKLPTIEGQTANWSYSATFGPLSNDDGGGYGQIFNTTVNGHQWVIYLIHTGKDLIPSRPNRGYQSGDPVAKIATTPFTHLHVNIGEDPTDANNGPGWLDPELLGMCVNL